MIIPENVKEALSSTRGLSSWLNEATKDDKRQVKDVIADMMKKAEQLNDANRPGFQYQAYRPRAASSLNYNHETDCI